MLITKEQATVALAEAGAADERARTLTRYRHFAPHAILWGAIWLIANTISDLYPAWASRAWMTLLIAGVGGGFWIGVRAGRAQRAEGQAGQGWRWLLSMLVLFGFLFAGLAVLAPNNGAQAGTFISLFFAAAYMMYGIWSGWKVLLLGGVMAAALLIGYFAMQSHYQLWMGAVAGGCMIVGGLWMRQA
ncbi:MAG: hypothetical protein QM718_11995 [Steroidobacteraceae bacterium]